MPFSTLPSPRLTLASEDDELEVFNVWSQPMSTPEPGEPYLIVAPDRSSASSRGRPSFFRRGSTSARGKELNVEKEVAIGHIKSCPATVDEPPPPRATLRRPTLRPPTVGDEESNSSFDPDKSPLYQRRRRKNIMSEDSATSIANLSTCDGSGSWD
ncbi:unnamed protein product [Durusdinium trenchii]